MYAMEVPCFDIYFVKTCASKPSGTPDKLIVLEEYMLISFAYLGQEKGATPALKFTLK